MNFGAALAAASGRIDPREAKLLLREASGASAAAVAAFPERELGADAAAKYFDWLSRRELGEPIAYLVGWREFFSRRFEVGPGVLIPRPETELLVEAVLGRIARAPSRVLDLGTGSGAIAISIACEAPQAEVWALDASDAALAIARRNATALGARVRFAKSDWFSALADERFDVLVSNPPYIAERDPHLEQGDLRSEPRSALASGQDGLDDIRRIILSAPSHLRPDGWLLFEHGYDQAAAVRELIDAAGFVDVASLRDLAGIERVSLGRWCSEKPVV
jgi:release factor glutamine methyltransferase